MSRKRALFICGSINQTTQMQQIARELPELDHAFSPYYGDAHVELLRVLGFLEGTIGGNRLRARCVQYLRDHGLPIDVNGRQGGYDLVFHCSDLVCPSIVGREKTILVQEGMTDPENWMFRLAQKHRWIPLWLAGTSATGLSDRYDRFCVASPGYKDLFAKKGAKAEKIVVTGIPNFDDCERYTKNDFPHRGYVLVCTTDIREVFGFEDRPKFLRDVVKLASGRQLVFKLHPNEKLPRATREIEEAAPGALVFQKGSAEEMVANCDVLVTQYSSLAFVGLALGKEVHSFFDLEELKRLVPLQNKSAAKNIANVARELLGLEVPRADAPASARPTNGAGARS